MELPGPCQGIRGRSWCITSPSESQETSNTPGAEPEIKKRKALAEDSGTKVGERGTIKKKIGNVLLVKTTGRAGRRGDSTNPVKIGRKKKRVTVGAKARELTTDRPRQASLGLVNLGESHGGEGKGKSSPPGLICGRPEDAVRGRKGDRQSSARTELCQSSACPHCPQGCPLSQYPRRPREPESIRYGPRPRGDRGHRGRARRSG